MYNLSRFLRHVFIEFVFFFATPIHHPPTMTLQMSESDVGCDVCAMNCLKEENLIGSKKYDYRWMCKPHNPFRRGRAPAPQWFSKDEKLPLLLSLTLGLQHCLAMLAGIATSGGYLLANDTCLDWQYDSQMCGRLPWMISCAWLSSGILTIVQVFRCKIKGTSYYLGTGLISVMGSSFSFLPSARAMTIGAILDAQSTACEVRGNASQGEVEVVFTGHCCHKYENGRTDCFGAGALGYGAFLGTALVASVAEIVLGLMPPHVIKKLMPPVVTGSAVMLIGGSLISSAVKYIGGGIFCAENTESRIPFASTPQLCVNDNGDMALSFGSSEYVGLGFSVIGMSIFLQIVGSPFLKSTFLFWSLMFGCIVAAPGGVVDGERKSFFRNDFIEKGKPITFLWAEGTFPLSFSGENFLPILIAFLISSAETIGDVEMTCIFSRVTDPEDRASRIQGGLLADGVNSFFATLFGSPPNTTYSQNNGLIALTRCASRSVGFSCAFWLICLGIFGKMGALFASIPICVIGGLVLQAFSSVFVSGLKVATTDFTRRNQFILMLSLGIGLGVAMEGQIFEWPTPYVYFRRNLAYDYGFWPEKTICKTPNERWIAEDGLCHSVGPFGVNNGNCCAEYDASLRVWRGTILTVLQSPFAIGFILAFLLNLLIPEDLEMEVSVEPENATEIVSSSTKANDSPMELPATDVSSA